jgi:hypothetical protein
VISDGMLLMLCSVNLVVSFVNFYLLLRSTETQGSEEQDQKEDLLVEKDLNSRLRYLQTTRFGPSMIPHIRDEALNRKIEK